MKMRLCCLALALLSVASCARLDRLTGGPAKKEEKPQPFGPTGIPPQLRSKTEGTPVTPGANVTLAPANITPESDIAWTDPDHPEAGIPELSTLMEGPKQGPWEESDKSAFRRASREGKPVLIWFTDSKNSPGCKALAAELFAKTDFESWVKDRFVRLRIDSQVRQRDPNLSLDEAQTKEANQREYVATLKKRYKVLGHPTLLVLAPDGEVIGRYKGYKTGDADYFWGLLKQGDTVAQKRYGEWRAGLEKKGYREWQDRSGRKVFAKLLAYSEGKLLLVEPDGARSKTVESRLSDADREWIKQQKAARGL